MDGVLWQMASLDNLLIVRNICGTRIGNLMDGTVATCSLFWSADIPTFESKATPKAKVRKQWLGSMIWEQVKCKGLPMGLQNLQMPDKLNYLGSFGANVCCSKTLQSHATFPFELVPCPPECMTQHRGALVLCSTCRLSAGDSASSFLMFMTSVPDF